MSYLGTYSVICVQTTQERRVGLTLQVTQTTATQKQCCKYLSNKQIMMDDSKLRTDDHLRHIPDRRIQHVLFSRIQMIGDDHLTSPSHTQSVLRRKIDRRDIYHAMIVSFCQAYQRSCTIFDERFFVSRRLGRYLMPEV